MTYSAISDVTTVLLETLREGAEDERSPLDPAGIEVASPNDVDSLSDLELTLYPYHVETDNAAGSVSSRTSGNTRHDPPLSLTAYYLVTAYAGGDDDGRSGDGEGPGDPLSWGDRLGAALQVFHDNSQIDPAEAPAPLYQEQHLAVTIVDEPLDDVLTLWSQFDDASYRPSATLEVSPIVIQSLNEEEFTRVDERETSVGRHVPEDDDGDDRLDM